MYLTCVSVAALCCSLAAVPSTAVLLLAGVRDRVSDHTISCCVILDLIPVFSFSSFQNKIFFHVPLGSTVACSAWL